GPVRCGTVVCAAGRWSRRLLGGAGVDLPQNTVRETVVATEPVPALTQAAVWGPDLAFRQMPSGALVISGEAADVVVTPQSLQHLRLFLPTFWRNRHAFRLQLGRATLAGLDTRARRDWRPGEPEPNSRVVATLTERFGQWFPERGRPRVAQAWAGVIDGTPDMLPVVQALAAPSGLIVATGLSGHGFALGPILGEVVADLATTGATPFDLRPLRLGRFAEGDYERAKSIL
ncbi:MAG TPA: FAD-binding oxidoreductase, partial [Candidatus Dormibacteraeota bacterium]|nr:FAD-binding oxidoreductase [Candidatus Dormibacteraeota bacterium]